jgi:transglutaminase-like putative cysteine protease
VNLHIQHTTRYTYTEPLRHAVQSLHLWPVSGPHQTVRSWSLRSPATLHARTDAMGNRVHHGSLTPSPRQPPVREVTVVASGTVHTHAAAPSLDAAVWTEPTGPHPAVFLRSTPMAEPHVRMARWALEALGLDASAQPRNPPHPTPAQALALAEAVGRKVAYRPGRTDVETSALEAFDWGLGVCQDQAHVMVAVCRSLGWPARYVSGYFHAADEPELASHAWVDVCVHPDTCAWLSLDVTHACPTDQRHVRLAVGTDYSTCAPVRGLRQGGGHESMAVEIRIRAEP